MDRKVRILSRGYASLIVIESKSLHEINWSFSSGLIRKSGWPAWHWFVNRSRRRGSDTWTHGLSFDSVSTVANYIVMRHSSNAWATTGHNETNDVVMDPITLDLLRISFFLHEIENLLLFANLIALYRNQKCAFYKHTFNNGWSISLS